MPLPPMPSRRDAIAGDNARIAITRWDGVPELGAALLLPTRPELTAGYEHFAAALAGHGISVVLPDEAPTTSEEGLVLVERLLSALRTDGAVPFVVLIGHGLGGLVVAGYLESDRRQPDLAVLMSPELRGPDKRRVTERLRSILGRGAPDATHLTAARVLQ